MRVGVVSVALMMAAFTLTAVGSELTPAAATAHAIIQPPAGFEANTTQAVCALTGDHGATYVEQPHNYTTRNYGLISGDAGSSFEYDGQVWWLFGNTGASQHLPWGKQNQTNRWPDVPGPLNNAAALGSDSIANSSEATPPPAPAAPYNNSEMPPDQKCPKLHFVTETPTPGSPFVNPSVYPDPMFKQANYYVSLRRGELPEAGIAEGNSMYVVFGTDNPANCLQVFMAEVGGPCTSPPNHAVSATCGDEQKGSRTRSVMAVYEGNSQFRGLYDLSAPTNRYWPLCPTKTPAEDDARFVNVQMQQGTDGYVYIWGTEGGANNNLSPVDLARIPAEQIATGYGIQYWNGATFVAGPKADPQTAAKPLFPDQPSSCAAQVGIQYNQYLSEWILLYRCNEAPAPAGIPNGIYMRTAKNPWGPWSAPTTIFNPAPDSATQSGFCYFIYSSGACPSGSPNSTLADSKQDSPGGDYGPYFVANWTTGVTGTTTTRASTTIYYTLDTFDPYGQLIMRSTILGPALQTTPLCSKHPCQ